MYAINLFADGNKYTHKFVSTRPMHAADISAISTGSEHGEEEQEEEIPAAANQIEVGGQHKEYKCNRANCTFVTAFSQHLDDDVVMLCLFGLLYFYQILMIFLMQFVGVVIFILLAYGLLSTKVRSSSKDTTVFPIWVIVFL